MDGKTWCCSSLIHAQFPVEAVHICISYLDQFIATKSHKLSGRCNQFIDSCTVSGFSGAYLHKLSGRGNSLLCKKVVALM